MRRIINHWTAGTYTPNATDKKHYHIIIDGDGREHLGHHTIDANRSTSDGVYAGHTQGANTDSIGISCAAMAGAKERPFDAGDFPLKREQWDAMVKANARLCAEYGIAVTDKTVLTHAEVQANLGIKQRNKWDITRLPWDSSVVGAKAVGDKLRREVQAAMKAKPKRNVMMTEKKPALEHRRVQTLLGSMSGAGGIVGWFTGWTWEPLAVMALFALIVLMVFLFLYREEIKAGMFSARET